MIAHSISRNFVCIFFLISAIPLVPCSEILGSSFSPNTISESGSFSLVNSTDQYRLLERNLFSFNIGTIWNLTIFIWSNSSTGVNITKVISGGYHRDSFSGPNAFQVAVNESYSAFYNSTSVCDYIQELNFNYCLLDPLGYVWGDYTVQKINEGVPVNVGTDCIPIQSYPNLIHFPVLSSSLALAFLYFRRKK